MKKLYLCAGIMLLGLLSYGQKNNDYIKFIDSYANSKKEVIKGRIVRIKDGDTFVIVTDVKNKYVVRISCIDAPEKKQSYGDSAKKHLERMLLDQNVEIIYLGLDKYGRMMGKVLLNNMDIGLHMVQMGLAWVYATYCNEESYFKSEENARLQRLGLWSEEMQIAPWEYRIKKKKKKKG